MSALDSADWLKLLTIAQEDEIDRQTEYESEVRLMYAYIAHLVREQRPRGGFISERHVGDGTVPLLASIVALPLDPLLLVLHLKDLFRGNLGQHRGRF